MKKELIRDIRDMTDSREVLLERPHHFLAWFIYALIALVGVAVIWACVGEIDYYVKAQGNVRPNDSISTVRSTVTGKIVETNLEEGRQIARGELLFRLDAEMQTNTEMVLSRQYDSISSQIVCLEKYRTSLINGENLFREDDPYDADYYYKYQKYETDRDIAVEQARNTNTDYEKVIKDAEIQQSAANSGVGKYYSELSGWKLLRDSIKQDEPLVTAKTPEQYSRYIDYTLNIQRYESVAEQHQQAYDRASALYEAGGISRKDVEAAKSELDLALLDTDRYRNEVLLGAEQNISSLESSLIDLNAQSKSAAAAIEVYSQKGFSEELIANRYKLDALTATAETIFSLQNNLDSLYKDLVQIRLSIAEASVYAPIGGTINLYSELNTGDYVQSGTELATIVPDTSGTLKVQIAVSNSDIAEIQVGQDVHYRFAALPYNDYGELSGKITKISTDARRDNNGNSYYLVEGEISGNTLRSHNGSNESIKVGMSAEVRVITHTRKIIYWVLEKLNFIND